MLGNFQPDVFISVGPSRTSSVSASYGVNKRLSAGSQFNPLHWNLPPSQVPHLYSCFHPSFLSLSQMLLFNSFSHFFPVSLFVLFPRFHSFCVIGFLFLCFISTDFSSLLPTFLYSLSSPFPFSSCPRFLPHVYHCHLYCFHELNFIFSFSCLYISLLLSFTFLS